jgi:hypothetical protein
MQSNNKSPVRAWKRERGVSHEKIDHLCSNLKHLHSSAGPRPRRDAEDRGGFRVWSHTVAIRQRRVTGTHPHGCGGLTLHWLLQWDISCA